MNANNMSANNMSANNSVSREEQEQSDAAAKWLQDRSNAGQMCDQQTKSRASQTTLPENFFCILAMSGGYGGEVFPMVQAEFINMDHVTHFNRHSNLVNMANGMWFQLEEKHMVAFLDAIRKVRAQAQ